MSSGKAYGKDRDYQALCRDVLKRISVAPLKPYDGDGIDVTIYDVGGTKITFDVALRDPTGDLIVAECRRRKDVVKQEALFAFARKVDLLRQHTGRGVAGVFFAKRQFQIGAVKHGDWAGIQLVTIAQDQDIKGFSLTYQKYDASRSKRLQEAIVHLSGEVTPKGSLSLVVIRKDGKVEDIGDVK